MTLNDFECGTCGKRFEEMVERAVTHLPCAASACTGIAMRQLGGRPLHARSGKGSGGAADWPVGMAQVKVGDHFEPAVMRPVTETGDGGVLVEVTGSQQMITAMEPGKKLHIYQHAHTDDGDCITRDGVAQVLEEV